MQSNNDLQLALVIVTTCAATIMFLNWLDLWTLKANKKRPTLVRSYGELASRPVMKSYGHTANTATARKFESVVLPFKLK